MSRLCSHPDQMWQYPRVREICRQYIQGYCSYGAKCKYDHPRAGRPFDTTSGSSNFWTQSSMVRPEGYALSRQSYQTATQRHTTDTFMPPHSNVDQSGTTPREMDSKKASSVVAWKTTPCKHFIKNNGWCPLGDACNFIHDWQLVYTTMLNTGYTAEVPGPEGTPKHCWTYVQTGYCGSRKCQYIHPVDIQPYLKYTPCPIWPICDKRSTCPLKHPDTPPSEHSAQPTAMPPPTMPSAMPPVMPPPAMPPPPNVGYPTTYLPPPAPYPPVPKPTQIEWKGTTYFPVPYGSTLPEGYCYPAIPPPMPLSAPVHHTMSVPPPSFQFAMPPPPPCPPQPTPVLAPITPPPSYQHFSQDFETPEAQLLPREPTPAPTLQQDLEMNRTDQSDPLLEIQQNPIDNSAEAPKISPPQSQQGKRHARRISVNVKTGEVIEHAEGHSVVYGF